MDPIGAFIRSKLSDFKNTVLNSIPPIQAYNAAQKVGSIQAPNGNTIGQNFMQGLSTVPKIPQAAFQGVVQPGFQQGIKPYVQDLGNSVAQTAMGAYKASPVYQGIRAIQGNPVTPQENINNIYNTTVSGLGSLYRLNPTTPAMGALFGGIKGLRESKGNLTSSLEEAQKGVVNQPYVGEAVTSNPTLASAINMGALIAHPAGNAVKNAFQAKQDAQWLNEFKKLSPNAFSIHPEDEKELVDIIGKYQAKIKLNDKEIDTLQNLAEHYLGKNYYAEPTRKITLAFDYLLAKKNGGIPTAMSFPQPNRLVQEGNPEPLPWESPGATEYKQNAEQAIKEGENLNLAKKTNSKAERLTIDEAKAQADQASVLGDIGQNRFKEIFADWIGKRDSAKTKGVQTGSIFKDIPKELGPEIIKEMETPGSSQKPEVIQYVKDLRSQYESLFKYAKESGIDMGHLENYITHIWDRPQTEVAQMYKSLRQKFKFSSDRVLPTYEEGIQMHLKPKYTNPSQIIASYSQKLEQTKANIDFLNALKKEGYVVPAGIGAKTPGFVQINAPGFPRNEVNIGEGKTVIGGWYAPKNIADAINKVFSPQESPKLLSKTAGFSKGVQDLTLSGGVPGTPINAFTAANVQKEMLAGRIASPIKSLVKATIPGQAEKFFTENSGQIAKMQERNIPISTNVNIDSLGQSSGLKGIFEGGFKGVWNKAINDPTFKKFMPMLQINLFNDIEKQALSSGKTEQEAADIAAKAVKNFYGVIGSDTTALRSKPVEDIKSSIFFAPKFRESMMHFWVNNIKALKNPLAPENINNTKFMIGSGLTLLAMDQLNRYFNDGRSMLQNPKGTEDKLLIPISKVTGNQDDQTVVALPFLSSIATVPRALFREGMSTAQGDINGAVKDASQSYLSSAIKPVADIAGNSDYFGKEIYNDNMTPQEKYLAMEKYLANQYISHPYLKEILDPRNANDPAYQRLSRAMELPLRFYDQSSINSKFYYQIKDNLFKNLSPQEQSAFNSIPKSDTSDPNTTILKNQIYLTYPNVFKAKQLTELEMAAKTKKPIDPLYLVDYETAKKYMRYETLPPGSQDRKDLLKVSPELSVLFNMRSQFFDANPIPGSSQSNRPMPSARVQLLMNAKSWNDPEVRNYLMANQQYQNDQRAKLGLTPLASGSSFRKKPYSKVKKMKVPKIKLAKSKKPKLQKLKAVKPTKLKVKRA